MAGHSAQRILLIGDSEREIYRTLVGALPGTVVSSAATVFDGIAELSAADYSTVLVAAEPIERRPEAAVQTLRAVAGDSRIILFGHPTLELLSRKMLQFGCDDYMVTPASSAELQQMLGAPSLRLAGDAEMGEPEEEDAGGEPQPVPANSASLIEKLPVLDLFLDAMLQHPHDAPAAAVREINARLTPDLELRLTKPGEQPPQVPPDRQLVSHVIHIAAESTGSLHLLFPADEDAATGRHSLAQLSFFFSKLVSLQDRHNRLQKLAITDELTGLYNARYFRHFLSRILEKGRTMRFPVTLLLFDIDDFKKYNDQYGHGTGDEILVQTATMMRRCCRDHDLVARIGGDEFAVVFWEKEGPRQPRDTRGPVSSRPPQTPVQVFERFKRLMAGAEFTGLGSTGRGTLGISGGLAVFPYDATDAAGLIKAADEFLMFGAKQGGKNSIYLVGGESAAIDDS